MMVILMFMVMAMLMMRVMIIDHDNDNDGNEDYHYDHYVNDNDDFSATTILPLVNSPVLGRGPRFSSASISALNNLQSILEIAIIGMRVFKVIIMITLTIIYKSFSK